MSLSQLQALRWRWRPITAAAAAMLIALAGLLIPATAHAAPSPAVLWQVDFGGQSSNLLEDASGVTVQPGLQSITEAQPIYERFDKNGSAGAVVSGNRYEYNNSVADLSGGIYEVQNVWNGSLFDSTLRLRTASGVFWQTSLPSTVYNVFRIAIGNGRVYVLEAGTTPFVVHSFNAATGVQVSTFTQSAFTPQRLRPYQGGVVAMNRANRTVVYLNTDGELVRQIAWPSGYNLGDDATVTTTGIVYAAAGSTTGGSDALVAFTPNGVGWIQPVPASPGQITATADGGAIAIEVSEVGSSAPVFTLAKFSPTGATLWTAPLTTDGRSGLVLQATTSGRILVGLGGPSLTVDQYDQATGADLGTIAQATSDRLYQIESARVGDMGIAVQGDRMYLLAAWRDAQGEFRDSVLAFATPDLGLAYPQNIIRGTVGSSPPPSPSPSPSFSTSPTPTPSPTQGGNQVEQDSGGDSYSAGLGSGTYDPDSANPGKFNTCYRSKFAYGRLLNQRAGLGKMKLFACAGAVTDDFYVANPGNPGEPAQLSQIDPSAKEITLTISGNDSGFVHVVSKCTDGPRPDGTPVEDQGSYGCSKNQSLSNDVANRLAALSGHPTDALIIGRPIHPLNQLYKDIAARAPGAHILVGGYPRLFGTSPKYYQAQNGAPSGQVCQVGFTVVTRLGLQIPVFYRIDYDDAVWIDRLANKLNGVIQQAVAEAQTAGVSITYVPANRFNGHGLCDREIAWVHGLDITSGANPQVDPTSFHPTYTGQSAGYEPAFQAALG